MAKEQTNVYTLCEKIKDFNGRTHVVYPCPIRNIEDVSSFLAKVNPDYVFGAFMIAETDNEGVVIRNDDGKLIYGRTAVNELLDIVEIALRHKETREQIKEWLDVCLAQEIIEAFIGLSQVKKKKAAMMEKLTGTV